MKKDLAQLRKEHIFIKWGALLECRVGNCQVDNVLHASYLNIAAKLINYVQVLVYPKLLDISAAANGTTLCSLYYV